LFRASEEAVGSAARLRRLGFAVACLPVVTVVPLAFTPKQTRYDAVIATSSKAFPTLAPIDRAAPLLVVGARTARAAEADGWRLAAPPAPNVERLLETLKAAVPSGADVLYLAGRDRKKVLESALSDTFALEIAEVYAAETRECWKPAEIRSLGACTIALHYSRRSAALAAQLAERAGVGAVFRKITHICLSRDVATPLEAIGADWVRVAATPDEPALFATLVVAERLFPSHNASRI
jgi:uroporphyrinogen-III synthase